MMTSATGNISALPALCAGNSPVTSEFPSPRPVTRNFDVFFDLRLTNGWVNHRDAGDLRRNPAHCGVTVINQTRWKFRLTVIHSIPIKNIPSAAPSCAIGLSEFAWEHNEISFEYDKDSEIFSETVPHWAESHAGGSCGVPSGLILGLRPANERRRYFVTTSLIGWAQA